MDQHKYKSVDGVGSVEDIFVRLCDAIDAYKRVKDQVDLESKVQEGAATPAW